MLDHGVLAIALQAIHTADLRATILAGRQTYAVGR